MSVVAPVGSTETAKALVERAVEAFGRLDVIVTNAGILRDKVLWKMTDEDFDLVTAEAMAALSGEFWGNLVVAGGLAGLLSALLSSLMNNMPSVLIGALAMGGAAVARERYWR